jgi:addiction module RelE/StbE family toxin
MVQINWTFQAVKDLKDIAEYISKDSKLYAKRQIFKIRNRTNILKDYNYSGRTVPEIKDENIREILEGKYRIIYRVVNRDRIDIITVHHSSRDLHNRELF